ncbi:hypothetical protein ABIE71_000303 [Bradyrhizobium diazoefficiens]
MSKLSLCGEEISFWIGADCPFGNILFVDYDDGPTYGAAQCRLGSDTYRFELLARDTDGTYDYAAWDHGREICIFSLAPLPHDQFERLKEILSADTLRERVSEDNTFYNGLRAILGSADAPQFVVATHGIKTGIIAGRQVTPADFTGIADWFSFLNLQAISAPPIED